MRILATRPTPLLAAAALLTVCTGCATGGPDGIGTPSSTPGDSVTCPSTSGPHQTPLMLTTEGNFYPDPSKPPVAIASNGQISVIVYGGPNPYPQTKRRPRAMKTSGPHQNPSKE